MTHTVENSPFAATGQAPTSPPAVLLFVGTVVVLFTALLAGLVLLITAPHTLLSGGNFEPRSEPSLIERWWFSSRRTSDAG